MSFYQVHTFSDENVLLSGAPFEPVVLMHRGAQGSTGEGLCFKPLSREVTFLGALSNLSSSLRSRVHPHRIIPHAAAFWDQFSPSGIHLTPRPELRWMTAQPADVWAQPSVTRARGPRAG